MVEGVHAPNPQFNDEQWKKLLAWKERYEAHVRGGVTWADLLLAYANSKVLP